MLDGLPTDLIYLPDEKGVLRPVPANATLEDYIDFARNRNKPAAGNGNGLPRFSVSSVAWTGSADDERANLAGEIVVAVAVENQSVLVPLQLHEAILSKVVYRGNGAAVYDGYDRDQGHRWWFTGKGKHTLMLDVVVPVRKQVPQRRLQLMQPACATSSLELIVPFPHLSVKVPESSAADVQPLDDKRSRVKVLGLGSRIDTNWQPVAVVRPGTAALEAHTSLLVRMSLDSAQVRAIQVVQPVQGSVKEFTTILPHGAELQDIKCDDFLERKIDPQRPERVTVVLTEAKSTPIRAVWDVRIPWKDHRQTMLEGFMVDKARKQTGEIGLTTLDGLRLVASDVKDPNLVRILPEEERVLTTNRLPTRAYRFLNQPFKLPVEVESIQPYYISEPRLAVLLGSEHVELAAEFPVRVFRGAIQELTLRWPGWRAAGWQIESVEPRGELVEGIEEDDPGISTAGAASTAGNELRIRLVNPQKDKFTVQFRARRSWRTLNGTFQLPDPVTATTLPPTIAVYLADNIEGELLIGEGGTLRPLLAGQAEETAPAAWKPLRKSLWKVGERTAAPWGVKVSVHPQQIRVGTDVSLEVQAGGLLVRQEFDYQINYERLGFVTVSVPTELIDALRWRLADGRALTATRVSPVQGPVPIPVANPAFTLLRVMLPEETLGALRVIAEYQLQSPAVDLTNTISKRRIPILRSTEAEFAQVHVHQRDRTGRQLKIEAPSWQKGAHDAGQWTWIGTGSPQAVDIELLPWRRDGQTWTISRAWIRTIVNESGDLQTAVAYRLQGSANWLGFQLSENATLAEVRWNGRQLSAQASQLLDVQTGTYGFRCPPGGPATDALLEIQLQTPGGSAWGWNNLREIRVPQILESVSAAEVVWQVAIPEDQHLFDYERTVTPLFHWQRVGWLWGRVPDKRNEQLQHWMGLTGEDGLSVPSSIRNTYAFLQSGGAKSFQIRTWSMSLVVLTGVGISLGIGFLVLNLPLLQNIYGWLGLTLLVLFGAVLFRPQWELLLQPMVLGTGLPVIMGLWEYRRRPLALPQANPYPTSSQLDFIDHSPLSDHPFQVDQSTVLRRPEGANGPAAAAIESGSGVA